MKRKINLLIGLSLATIIIYLSSCSDINTKTHITDNTSNLDTLTLINLGYACECPDWFDYHVYESLGRDERDKISHELDFQNSYYIERHDSNSLLCNDYSRRIVEFIGKIDTTPRYSKDEDYQEPSPPKGKVFIYSSFRVIEKRKLDD